MRITLFLILILCVLGLCISPIEAGKSKGLFSGDILNIEIEAFIADIPDAPGFLEEKQEAVRENPMDTEAWIDIGKAQFRSDNYYEAEKAFSHAITQDPTNLDGWEGYLVSLMKLDNDEMLRSQAEKAIEQNPGWAKGYQYNGLALLVLERPEEARKVRTIKKQLRPMIKHYQSIQISFGL